MSVRMCVCVDTDLTVHSVELVIKGHGEVGGSAGGYVCDERGLALVDCVVHVHATLTDLHVLEAGFDTTKKKKKKALKNESGINVIAVHCHVSVSPIISLDFLEMYEVTVQISLFHISEDRCVIINPF